MSEARKPYTEVPIFAAEEIAKSFSKSIVVIVSYDPVHRLVHTTTFGVTEADKHQAAALGDLCAKAAGCDLSAARTFSDFRIDEAYVERHVELAAAAIANARGGRRGMPPIANVLEMLPTRLVDEVTDDARAALLALIKQEGAKQA